MMADSDRPEKFVESFEQPAQLHRELSRIESKLKMLDTVQLTALFLITFGKTWLVIQSAIALVAIVLFPVAAHYLNIMLPKRGLSPILNVWGYQQGILILGGVIAIGWAIVRATKAIKKGGGILQKEKASADDPCFSI